MAHAPYFTAPLSPQFMPTVAAHIVSKHTPEELAQAVIWVPSPRQVNALSKAINACAGGVVMLPTILPLHTASLQSQCGGEHWPQHPPAPAAAVHAFLLKHCQKEFPQHAFTRHLAMAEDLNQLLNQFMAYGITQEKLAACVPHGLAEHWRAHKQFLDIITTAYPLWLVENNYTDPHIYQQHLVHHIATHYRNAPTPPLYAIGFTDTTPAGITLLQAISANPRGTIIMPAWPETKVGEDLRPSDPAYAPLHMLQALEIPADTFTPLPEIEEPPNIKPELTYIPTNTLMQEVEVVSLILKKYAITAPHKTCAVITNNRAWAEKFKAQCAVMGLAVDDSGGTPLTTSLLGQFIKCWLACLTSHPPNLALSAWLHHPWWRMQAADIAAFEDTYLRDKVLNKQHAIYTHAHLPPAYRDALKAGWQVEHAPLDDWLFISNHLLASVKEHMPQAEHLVWADIEQHLHAASPALGKLSAQQAATYIEGVMREHVVRPPVQSKTLFLWGPLEARLQAIDVAIMVDMNEGSWPRLPTPNPWLNRRFYEELNMPDPLKPVGMAMLDAAYLTQAPEVYVTRCTQGVESATEESRVITQLKSSCSTTAWQEGETRGHAWLSIHEQWWQREEEETCSPPPITPATVILPAALKPTTLSATALEMLLNCPYKFAMRYGFGLKPLNDFGKDYTQAERGNIIHTLCQAFLEQVEGYPTPFKERVTANNLAAAQAHMATFIDTALANLPAKEISMWQPRLTLIMAAWLEDLASMPPERSIASLEQEGRATLNNITFLTRADRLDSVHKSHVLIDYKTGHVPSFAEVLRGTKPQMALESWVYGKGGFGTTDPLQEAEIHAMATSNKPFNISKLITKWQNKEPFTTGVEQALTHVVATYNKPTLPFVAVPRKTACEYCDYAGICRKAEGKGTHDE